MKSLKQKEMPAGEFKARCLQLMDEVNRTGIELIITKRGRPVAKLVPITHATEDELVGSMRGTVTIHGDIVSSDPTDWDDLA